MHRIDARFLVSVHQGKDLPIPLLSGEEENILNYLSEGNMKPQQNPGIVYINLILLLAIAGVLIAGCMDSTSIGQKTTSSTGSPQGGQVSVTPSIVPISGMTTKQPTTGQAEPVRDKSAPFITIDPVGDKKIGDILIISGTTSLPEKTHVYLSWTEGNSGWEKIISDRPILHGANETNRFRFVFDTTGFKPGIYNTTVATGKNGVSGSVQFSLAGTYLGTDTPVHYSGESKSAGSSGAPSITVQPPGDRQQGDIFLISGTTTLQAGTLLFFRVYPAYFEHKTKKPASSSNGTLIDNIGGDTIVIGGTGGTNRWSFAIDGGYFETMDYIVNVSTVNEDFTRQEVFGKSQFALR